MRWVLAVAAAFATGVAAAHLTGDDIGRTDPEKPIPLPSGQEARFFDVITTAAGGPGLTYRFRFIAPWIAANSDFDAVAGDMTYLCERYALPRLADFGPLPAQIVVSFAEEPVEFGQTAPGIVQYFEAYRPDGSSCVWELF